LANTDEQGISISQTNGNTLQQTDVINTVFKGVSGATGFRLRITKLYDFVSAHPINNTFSFYLNIIDLTQAFGEYLAEYLYSLTDHGVSIVKQIFTKDYYAYEAGGTKVSIESINGSPYPNAHITWQDEAGTVYGGSLDVTSGKLTVTHYGKQITDTSSILDASSGTVGFRARVEIPSSLIPPADSQTGYDDQKSNVATYVGNAGSIGSNFGTNSFKTHTNGNIYFYLVGYNTLADLKTYAQDMITANTPITFVWKLATPVTYQLTPTQISAIVGTNNIFGDTNGNTSVVYACSLKDYIDGQ
jgi:hypothetical protein